MFKYLSDLVAAIVGLTSNILRLSNTVARLDAEVADALPVKERPKLIKIEARDGQHDEGDHTTNGFVPPPEEKKRKGAK